MNLTLEKYRQLQLFRFYEELNLSFPFAYPHPEEIGLSWPLDSREEFQELLTKVRLPWIELPDGITGMISHLVSIAGELQQLDQYFVDQSEGSLLRAKLTSNYNPFTQQQFYSHELEGIDQFDLTTFDGKPNFLGKIPLYLKLWLLKSRKAPQRQIDQALVDLYGREHIQEVAFRDRVIEQPMTLRRAYALRQYLNEGFQELATKLQGFVDTLEVS